MHPLLLGVVALTSCGWFADHADVDELSTVAVSVLEDVDAEPAEDEEHAVSVTDVKLDRPYVSAQGIRRAGAVDDALDALHDVLDDDGWRVLHEGPVEAIAGYEVVATDDRLVVRGLVSGGEEGLAAYPPLDEGAHVAVLVANTNSGPAWTDVARYE